MQRYTYISVLVLIAAMVRVNALFSLTMTIYNKASVYIPQGFVGPTLQKLPIEEYAVLSKNGSVLARSSGPIEFDQVVNIDNFPTCPASITVKVGGKVANHTLEEGSCSKGEIKLYVSMKALYEGGMYKSAEPIISSKLIIHSAENSSAFNSSLQAVNMQSIESFGP